MEYMLVSTRNNKMQLVEAVNKLISEGWVPQGGIAVAFTHPSVEYFQAMVRVEKKDNV